MATRRVSKDFHGFLANASGYQYPQLQKLICPELVRRKIVVQSEVCYFCVQILS